MRIGILGGLFPREIRKELEIKSKGPIQYAADALQWTIVEGMNCYVENLTLINLPYIGSFPSRYKDIRMKSFPFSHREGAKDYNVGFLNLPLYKYYSRYIQSRRYLKSWVTEEDEILIIYAIHTPFILAGIDAKSKNSKLKLCLVVPDLPEFMGDKKSLIMDFLKKIEKKILDKALKKVDAFVVLSDYMREPLNIKDRPCIRVEGMYSGPIEINQLLKDDKIRSIFYSGTLAGRYGIVNLLNAFNQIKFVNYELWICGDGDTKDEIIERSRKDPRIKFFGQLPREEVLELQRKATVLVNPRTSEGEFTKYSFPSKTIEYLASGTPTIMYRLPGVPEEYFAHCFTVESKDPNGLEKSIIEACEMSSVDLAEFGRRASEFIMNNKTAKHQCGRIFNMLNKL